MIWGSTAWAAPSSSCELSAHSACGYLLRPLARRKPFTILCRRWNRPGPARERIALEPRQAPALPSVPAASEAQTLVEVLEWHAARHPDRLHLTVLQDETTILGTLTYGELATKARNVARGLIARDIVPGDRVALMLPTSIDFFAAFFGILYAGAIPVPIYPPMRLSQIEDHLRRQTGILRNAGARLLITMPEGRRLAGLLRAQVETLNAAESVENLERSMAVTGLPRVTDPIRRPSSNTPPAVPGIRKEWSLATRICSPTSGRWVGSWRPVRPIYLSAGCRSITTWV